MTFYYAVIWTLQSRDLQGPYSDSAAVDKLVAGLTDWYDKAYAAKGMARATLVGKMTVDIPANIVAQLEEVMTMNDVDELLAGLRDPADGENERPTS